MTSQVPNANSSVIVDSRITDVTVYSDQAKITRKGQISLTGQEQEFVLTKLPILLQTESIRVIGQGSATVHILGVRTQRVVAIAPMTERMTEILRQIEQIEEQKSNLYHESEAIKIQRNFIQKLSENAVDNFSESLANQHIALTELSQFIEFIKEKYETFTNLMINAEKQQRAFEKQLKKLNKELYSLQYNYSQATWNLIINATVETAGEFELEVSYLMQQARWKPLYDWHSNGTGDRLHLTYLAAVQQGTGEDWNNVNLTLSTAKPGLGTLPPKLDPWYIDTPKPESENQPLPLTSPIASQAFEELFNDELFNKLDSLEFSGRGVPNTSSKPIQAKTVAATLSQAGSIVTFKVNGISHIPNSEYFHQVTIFRDEYSSHPEYIIIPRLVSFAYLRATVTNASHGATLLPGDANVFRDNNFIGTTQLNNISPGQEFQVYLGIDEGLTLTRDLIEREVERKLIGGKSRIIYGYRLSITNLKDIPVNLILQEQLPVSRDEQIKVRLNHTHPKIALEEMGLLEWILSLQPQEKQEITYQFSVEYPPELTIVGLDI